MSDTKVRRTGRESGHIPGRSEIRAVNAAPSDPVPTIVPETPVAPEAFADPPAAVGSTESRFAAESPVPVAASLTGGHGPEAPVEAASLPPSAAESDDAWTALSEVQAALARGFTEIAVEITGLTRAGIAVAADAAVAMLGAKTFAEAVEINATLARRGADAMVEGSAKLSEIGVAAMTEVTQPILSRLGGVGVSSR